MICTLGIPFYGIMTVTGKYQHHNRTTVALKCSLSAAVTSRTFQKVQTALHGNKSQNCQYATWSNRLFQVYSAITVNHSWCLAWLGTPGKQGVIITAGCFRDFKPRSMPEPSARNMCKRTWMWEIPFPSDNYWKTDRWTHLQDCQLPGLSEVPALG